MFFRRAWLVPYYLEPLRRGASRLARIAVADALGGSGPAAAGAHCAHCKGRAADCACTAVCARTAASQCSPTLASLWSALVVDAHGGGGGGGAPASSPGGPRQRPIAQCAHCLGGDDTCACREGCARPDGADCYHLHPTVLCDGCGAAAIHGYRYTCATCDN